MVRFVKKAIVCLAVAASCGAGGLGQNQPPAPPGENAPVGVRVSPPPAPQAPADPAQYLQNAWQFQQQQRHDEAALAFLEVYKKFPADPGAPQALLMAAEATALAGRPADALKLYETAADKFPENIGVVNAHFKMSKLYEDLGRGEEAVNALKLVMKKSGDFEAKNAARLLVELYFRLDRVNEGQALSDRILAENPSDVQFLITLANSYELEKNYETAVRIYENVLKANRGNFSYEYKLYNVLKLGGLLDEYLERLEAEKKKNPGDLEPVRRLVRFFQWDDRSLDALVQLEIIVKREPENLSDAVSLAQHYYRNQWKSKARETLGKVLEKDGNYEPALREMGNLIFLEGDAAKAKELWGKAAFFNEGDEASYRRLAGYFLPMNLYAEAAALYEKGREYFRNDTLFAQDLAYIYERQMQKEKALREYVRLVEMNGGQQGWADSILKFAAEEGLAGAAAGLLKESMGRQPENQELKLTYGEVMMSARAEGEGVAEAVGLAGGGEGAPGFLVELAARRQRRGALGHAAALFGAAAEIAGGHRPMALLQAGRAWLAAGDAGRAEGAFRALAGEAPGTPGVDEALSLLADIAENGGRYAEARGLYARLAAEYPASPWYEAALVGEARGAFHTGDLGKAGEAFEALAQRPGSGRSFDEIMFYRAECRFLALELDAAEKLYTQLLDQYPESRRVNDAITRMMFLEDAAEADPIQVQAFAAAEKMALEGKADSAESVLRGLAMTLEDGPLRNHARIRLAELLFAGKRYGEAVDVLAGVIENKMSEHKLKDEAHPGTRFELFAKVDALPEGEPAARAGYMLAEAYFKLGRKEESLRMCQAVLDAAPGSYWARRARDLAGKLAEAGD